MSRLEDLQQALIDRLETAKHSGNPAFATVRGCSGGTRSVIRECLERERMPAALLAFIEEPLSPQTRAESCGAKFTVFVAARSIRVGADPRQTDGDAPGAFALMESARAVLDDYEVAEGLRVVPLLQRFIEADARLAVYALDYRVWPIVEATLQFDGVALAGSQSRLTLELGTLEMAQPAYDAEPTRPGFSDLTGLAPRELYWRGELRAPNHAAMNTIEENIAAALSLSKPGIITDGTGRAFENCLLEKLTCNGPRRPNATGQDLIQEAELQFLQIFSQGEDPQS